MEILFWIWVLTWMVQRGVTDGLYAFRGKPNPRYELKKAKALAAGQAAPQQPRYGGREWFADLLSDALAANTEKRRKAAKAKAEPVDDMVDVVRERHPHDPNNTRNCPTCKGEVVLDGRPCPRCLAEQQRRNAEWEAEHPKPRPLGDIGEEDWCERHQMPRVRQGVTERGPRSRFCPCGPRVDFVPPETPEDEGLDVRITAAREQLAAAAEPTTARIYQFPTVKHIEKEISMSNEVTGLTTAMAFAEAAAKAHQSFATSGAEGYVGALERGGNGAEAVGSAKEAMEASSIAADRWAAHREVLAQQQTVKEAYQGQPDAADKGFLLAE